MTQTNTTNAHAAALRTDGYKITAKRPGVIAANDGVWFYRFQQTSAGWTKMSLGRIAAR